MSTDRSQQYWHQKSGEAAQLSLCQNPLVSYIWPEACHLRASPQANAPIAVSDRETKGFPNLPSVCTYTAVEPVLESQEDHILNWSLTIFHALSEDDHSELFWIEKYQIQYTTECLIKALSTGSLSWRRSRSLISFARSSWGIWSKTSLEFEINLCKCRPPLVHMSVVFLMTTIASACVGTDFKPSST